MFQFSHEPNTQTVTMLINTEAESESKTVWCGIIGTDEIELDISVRKFAVLVILHTSIIDLKQEVHSKFVLS